MKIKNWTIAFVLVCVMLSACIPGAPQENQGGNTLFVGPFWKPCEDVSPRLCLEVKESNDGEWQLFYDSIEGFVYEPGFTYQLEVQKETVENPPADASGQRWILVNEVSKSPVEMPKLDLTGTAWQLISLNGAAPAENSRVTLEFIEAAKFGGAAGCNSFFGEYTLQGLGFATEGVGSTLMACDEPQMSQESAYLSALGSSKYLYIVEDSLLLVSADGSFLEFTSLVVE